MKCATRGACIRDYPLILEQRAVPGCPDHNASDDLGQGVLVQVSQTKRINNFCEIEYFIFSFSTQHCNRLADSTFFGINLADFTEA